MRTCQERKPKHGRVWNRPRQHTCPQSIHMCLQVAYSSYLKVIRCEDHEIRFLELRTVAIEVPPFVL